MYPITIDEFVKKTISNNKDISSEQLKHQLSIAINKKKQGVKCSVCGNTIWAIGTAMCGWNGCFSCITGETDDSDDYEIDSINN